MFLVFVPFLCFLFPTNIFALDEMQLREEDSRQLQMYQPLEPACEAKQLIEQFKDLVRNIGEEDEIKDQVYKTLHRLKEITKIKLDLKMDDDTKLNDYFINNFYVSFYYNSNKAYFIFGFDLKIPELKTIFRIESRQNTKKIHGKDAKYKLFFDGSAFPPDFDIDKDGQLKLNIIVSNLL